MSSNVLTFIIVILSIRGKAYEFYDIHRFSLACFALLTEFSTREPIVFLEVVGTGERRFFFVQRLKAFKKFQFIYSNS